MNGSKEDRCQLVDFTIGSSNESLVSFSLIIIEIKKRKILVLISFEFKLNHVLSTVDLVFFINSCSNT